MKPQALVCNLHDKKTYLCILLFSVSPLLEHQLVLFLLFVLLLVLVLHLDVRVGFDVLNVS